MKINSRKTQKAKENSKNLPKRVCNEFFLFSKENSKKIRAENPKMSVGDVARQNGIMWQNMSPDEKKPFLVLKEKDQARFHQETSQMAKMGYFVNSDGLKCFQNSETKVS